MTTPTSPTNADDAAAAPSRPQLAGALITAAIAALLVGWLIPAALGTTWPQIGTAISHVRPEWLFVLVAASAIVVGLDTAGFARAFSGLRAGFATTTNLMAQALSVGLPLGSTIAIGLTMKRLRRVGLNARTIGSGIILSTLADVTASIVIPALGLVTLGVVLLPQRTALSIVLVVVGVLALALAAALWRLALNPAATRSLMARAQDVYNQFNEGFGRASTDISGPAVSAQADVARTPTRDHAIITGGPTLARIVQCLAFAAWCAWGLGIDAPFLGLAAVYAAARLLALIPVTPGGVGTVDAAAAWGLVALGASAPTAVTAALVFTITHVLMPAIVGGALLITGSRSTPRAATGRPRA